MSVRTEARNALVDLLEANVDVGQILRTPPAENQEIREAIWVERTSTRWEWRYIGVPDNREQVISFFVRVQVYREDGDQLSAADEAQDRCEDIIDQVERAIAADSTLGNTVTSALLSDADTIPTSRGSGWLFDASLRVDATRRH